MVSGKKRTNVNRQPETTVKKQACLSDYVAPAARSRTIVKATQLDDDKTRVEPEKDSLKENVVLTEKADPNNRAEAVTTSIKKDVGDPDEVNPTNITFKDEKAVDNGDEPSGDITSTINALKRQVADADVSLAKWIAQNKPKLSKELPPTSDLIVDDDRYGDEPPPLDDFEPEVLGKSAPKTVFSLATPLAASLAIKLGIPVNILKLPLSPQLAFLDTLFVHLDHVISLAGARGQQAVFARLIAPLELSLKKRVREDEHLKDGILAVWPQAYTVEPCKVILDGLKQTSSRIHFPTNINPMKETNLNEMERRVTFRWHLIQYMAREHALFLSSTKQDCPSIEKLAAWHPKFPLKDIQMHREKKEPNVAKEKDKGCLTPPLSSKDSIVLKPNLISSSLSSFSSVGRCSSSSSLLERIQAKQAASEVAKMTAAKAKDDKGESSLPELVDRLLVIFTSCRKNVMPLEDLIQRLSSTNAGKDDSEIIKRLTVLIPEWLTIVQLNSQESVLRIDKNIPIKTVKEWLTQRS